MCFIQREIIRWSCGQKLITVVLYTQVLDKKQHNHELKGDYLKLILHSRHVFLQYTYLFV